MKYALSLSLLFILLSPAWAQQSGLYVDDLPLEQIDTEYFELRIIGERLLSLDYFFSINYGQPCFTDARNVNRRAFRECGGLRDAQGDLVSARQYFGVLSDLKRAGWEIVHTWSVTIDGFSVSPDNVVFLMTRIPPEER